MSVKVYEAYRVPEDLVTAQAKDGMTLSDRFDKAAFSAAKRFLLSLVKTDPKNPETPNSSIVLASILEGYGIRDGKKIIELMGAKEARIAVLIGLARVASESLDTDIFDLDCSYNMWFVDGYAYVIPYYPRHLKVKMPFLAGFSYRYWSNTDPDKSVCKEEWFRRGEFWNRIGDNWDSGRYVHTAIELKGNVGLMRLINMMFKGSDTQIRALSVSTYVYSGVLRKKEEEKQKAAERERRRKNRKPKKPEDDSWKKTRDNCS